MIETSGIWKIYQIKSMEVPVLRDVTFRVEDGEMVAIMGTSGSGKSTLMNILGCLDKPTRGSYKLNGIEVTEAGEKELTRIRNRDLGFIFQSYNLVPHLTALENVNLALFFRGQSNSKLALDFLDKVGLKDRADHKPSELSGGQQQRVAIARALIKKPSVILADEPTGALDTNSSKELMKLLTDLNQTEGISMLLVTHDPVVASYAQRIIRIDSGMIVSGENNFHQC